MRTLEKIIRFIDWVANLLGRLAGWLVVVMMLLVAVEVVMRYAFSKPPMIADEFSGYLLVAISFLGMSFAYMNQAHIRITIVQDRVGTRTADFLRLISLALGIVFTAVFTYATIEYMQFSIMIDERSASWMNFPLRYPQATITIGFFVFTLLLTGEFIKSFYYLKTGHHFGEQSTS